MSETRSGSHPWQIPGAAFASLLPLLLAGTLGVSVAAMGVLGWRMVVTLWIL